MIDYFEDGGELFDGHAIDRTDRTSHAYKLGRCIGALENIVRLIEDPIRCTAGYAPEQIQELAQVVITARNCLKAIGHELRS